MRQRALWMTPVFLFACGDDDGATPAADAGPGDDGGGVFDIGPAPECVPPGRPDPMCEPLPTDYAPGADDMWPGCVSDGGDYVRIQDSISTIARVRGFEDVAALLFDRERDPSDEEFLSARRIYQEDEGLDSRVVRRYDPRFDVPEGTDCTQMGVPAMFPDYCVGPARLQPILLDAFRAGVEGTSGPSRVEAARIEAGLLWFLYASVSKESLTCTGAAKDCDSAYAYYTGGEEARDGIGLARYIEAADPEAHDRAWDGIFALRCWRDLDGGETATDLALRDRARAQLDRAISHGLAMILRERLSALCDLEGDALAYEWTFVQTVAPALEASAQAMDATQAAGLQSALAAARPADADIEGAIAAIDALYVCP